jgi:LiaI-LiaF-like transmembrane region
MNAQEINQQQQPPTAAPPPAAPALPAPMPAAAPTRRSPGLALVLSFFPGLGHLYLGLYQRAFAVFLSFAVSIWLAEHADLGILIAFVWFFAVIDAYRQAQLLNLGLTEEPVIPAAQRARVGRRGNLGFGLFLLIVGAVLLYNQFYPIDFSFLQDWWPLLLVLCGIYMVAAHFREKQRQARLAAKAGEPTDSQSGV